MHNGAQSRVIMCWLIYTDNIINAFNKSDNNLSLLRCVDLCIHMHVFNGVKTFSGFVKGFLTKPSQRSCIYKYLFDFSPMTPQSPRTTKGSERCYYGNSSNRSMSGQMDFFECTKTPAFITVYFRLCMRVHHVCLCVLFTPLTKVLMCLSPSVVPLLKEGTSRSPLLFFLQEAPSLPNKPSKDESLGA